MLMHNDVLVQLTPTVRLVGCALIAGLFALTLAPVQDAEAGEPKVNVERFEASPHAGDMMAIRTAEQPADDGLSGGFFLTYGKDPLRLEDKRYPNQLTFQLVDHQVVGDLFAAYSLWKQLSIGVNVPVVGYAGGDNGFVGTPPADGFGLGDVRVAAKWLLLARSGAGFGIALEPGVALPTAGDGTYAGDGSITFTPRLVLDLQVGETLAALNVGYKLRDTEAIGPYDTGSDVQVGLGLRQSFSNDRFRIIGELLSASSQEDFMGDNGSSLEGQIGANVCLADFARLYAAGGGGFTDGIGDTSLRLTTGLRFESCGIKPEPVADRDRDGIPDDTDACPDTPGKRFSDPSMNGCPDRDGDGIIDKVDACPDEAGKPNQDAASHGCPDLDGDGIIDLKDACPRDPGPASDNPGDHGCPDRDGDGIVDRDDACPDLPGQPHTDPALNGCPDRDGDGVIDPRDACPDTPGEPSDQVKLNGCPPPKLTKEKIVIIQRIEFDVDDDVILSEWKPVLDEVARVILEHDEIAVVTVGGHTDNTFTAAHNLQLSKRRAKAVRKYLIQMGVASGRLKAKGFGLTQPIDDNSTEEGRQRNRRVEFKVKYKN